jgi:hypothetical protein
MDGLMQKQREAPVIGGQRPGWVAKEFTSPPLQNARPAPVMRTAPKSLLCSHSRRCAGGDDNRLRRAALGATRSIRPAASICGERNRRSRTSSASSMRCTRTTGFSTSPRSTRPSTGDRWPR